MSVNLRDKVDPRHTALIIVDVQNDFCHRDGALAGLGMDTGPIEEMVPRLIECLRRTREESVPVVKVLYTRRRPQREGERDRSPVHLVFHWGGGVRVSPISAVPWSSEWGQPQPSTAPPMLRPRAPAAACPGSPA